MINDIDEFTESSADEASEILLIFDKEPDPNLAINAISVTNPETIVENVTIFFFVECFTIIFLFSSPLHKNIKNL